MIHGAITFHNVEEMPRQEDGGHLLQRLPGNVLAALSPGGQKVGRHAAGVEIRYHSPPGEESCVRLRSLGESQAIVFFGGFQAPKAVRIGGEETRLPVRMHERLAKLHREIPCPHFPPEVVRVCLTGDPVVFLGAEGAVAALPVPPPVPRLRYLAYGSSLTHGCHASAPHLSYPALVGRRLGLDALNLGLRGAAFCEPELADYLSGREDWDVATLELSANMVERSSDEEFLQRVGYFVSAFAGRCGPRPVFAITVFPHFRDLPGAGAEARRAAQAKRNLLRQAVAEAGRGKVRLLEGEELLAGVSDLTDDLLHIGDAGFASIAEGISAAIGPVLP